MSVTARRGAAQALAQSHVLAFRLRQQRLDQRTSESIGEVVRSVAYVATPGGATPYLALRARSPRFDRRLVERSVFEGGELVEVPFARGLSVLVPSTEMGAALAAAVPSHRERLAPLAKAGVLDERKLARLGEAVVAALSSGPLAADDLRARLPEALCVPLGEAGRKAGFASLFSVSLRQLQVDGLLSRRPRERRLDRENFVYAATGATTGPLPRADALTFLARRFFRAYPAASAQLFAHWADASIAETRAAIAEAGLRGVALEGSRDPGYVAPEDLEVLATFEPPSPARLAFVPFRDPALSGTKDLRALLADHNRGRLLADWRGRLVPAGGGSVVHQHVVLLGGFVAGIWQYDENQKSVSYATFDPLPTRMRRAADDAAEELGTYIADHLGTARFYADERAENFGRLDEVVSAWASPVTPDR